MENECVLAEQRDKRTGGLKEQEKQESHQGPPNKVIRFLPHDSSCKVHLVCIFSVRTMFSEKSTSKSSKHDLLLVLLEHLMKNICKQSSLLQAESTLSSLNS